jgi:peptidylprolyl isomerase
VALTGTACSQSSTPSASQSTTPAETQSAAAVPSDTAAAPVAPAPAPAPAEKLQIKDLKVGKGAAAKTGDSVTVEYTGWLADGTKFDSNVGKAAFPVTIGAGQVIEGWDQGLVGLKVGGTRTLIIPPSLGYGAEGSPPVIPANATLKFDVKLISLTPGQ